MPGLASLFGAWIIFASGALVVFWFGYVWIRLGREPTDDDMADSLSLKKWRD